MMWKYGFRVAVLSTILLLASSCGDDNVTGSGKRIDVDYPMRDISRVAAFDGFSADITLDDSIKVAVRMDDNILGYVEVEQDGPTVQFRLDEKGRTLRNIYYHAYVTLKYLRGLDLTDESKASIIQLNTVRERFECTMTKNSRLNGAMNMTEFMLDESGGSDLIMGGSADSARLTVGEKSTCDLSDLAIGECTVSADGGSTVFVNVTGTLNVTIKGKSRVYFRGTPVMGAIDVEEGSSLRDY